MKKQKCMECKDRQPKIILQNDGDEKCTECWRSMYDEMQDAFAGMSMMRRHLYKKRATASEDIWK